MVHVLPPTVTVLPVQASMVFGKPVPSMVRVVPPPTLPELGLKLTTVRDSVNTTDPVAWPRDFTHRVMSKSPAGPFSRVQVTDAVVASVASQARPPTSMLKSAGSVVKPVPVIVRTTDPSTRASVTPMMVGVREAS